MQAHSAAIVNDYLNGPGIENTFQDTDGDRILRECTAGVNCTGIPYTSGGQTYNIITTGAWQEGDILEAVLRFDTINSSSPDDLGNSDYSLVAYAQIEIASLKLNNNGTADAADDFYDVVYAASGNLGTNVLVEVYEEDGAASINFTSTSPGAAIAKLLDPTGDFDLIAEFGIDPAKELDATLDPDYWTGTLPLNIDLLALLGTGTGNKDTASGIYGLSLITNPGAIPVAENAQLSTETFTYHDLVGNASVKNRSANFNAGWLIETDSQVFFVTAVPEPSVLFLMGAGLVGLGFARKRAHA